MVMLAKEYRCMCCNTEIDETEFGDPDDADVCGYCFTDKLNEVKRRKENDWPSHWTDVQIQRESCFIADVELRLEDARKNMDGKLIKAYKQILRMLES